MRLLLVLIIPTITILTPLIILISIGRRKNKIDRVNFVVAILGCFLLGLVVPIVATFLSAQGLVYSFEADSPKCVTGAAVFIFFGYLVNLIGVPLAGIALFPPKHRNSSEVS
ncbi:hypothetical protein [Chryseosolibacter indicus]|uniref:Uncharacterized protein n=1 Tax=Chryseosolibacter indicus TaxID=2782351 RepID=A0ABS5VWN0_9BACT|nr:hypothetical protein [Chryseosolibacter indicus]MBT1705827.1 hypothetical protein [Chryseosolibacter indicus]